MKNPFSVLKKRKEDYLRSRQDILAREKELYEKMQQIELFPGTLDEFERLKVKPYEIIMCQEIENLWRAIAGERGKNLVNIYNFL